MSECSDPPDDEIFKIIIATDNHLGYQEDDKIRGNDSFYSFNEVLQVAEQSKADFVLLGGDLFHH
jgi:double-strand break repair protein MRE11